MEEKRRIALLLKQRGIRYPSKLRTMQPSKLLKSNSKNSNNLQGKINKLYEDLSIILVDLSHTVLLKAFIGFVT